MYAANRTLCKRGRSINSETVKKAYEWARNEMEEYNIPITESIRIVRINNFRDSNDASVSFFYDREREKALCRVHWKTGEIRYDEVANFTELLFASNEFVTHLLTNGIRISNLYTALGH